MNHGTTTLLESPVPIARFRLRLRATSVIQLPPYAGSMWRGALGHALKRLVCVTKQPDCRDCLLYRSCLFPYAFDTPPPIHAAKLRRYPSAPHPFIVEPWSDCRPVAAGQTLGLDLVLIGRGIAHLPFFIEAFGRAGAVGVGREGGTFELDTVEFEQDQAWRVVYAAGGRLGDFAVAPLQIPAQPPGDLRLEVCTPLRLRVGNELAVGDRLRFRDFFSTLLRRVSLLTYFHNETSLETDFKGIVARADAVAWQHTQLRWQDWARWSSRQDTLVKMGGVIGSLTLAEQDLGPLWPYLWLGQWTHVGKGAVMGLGRYRLHVG